MDGLRDKTGKPDLQQSMGPQRVRHDWGSELNWTEVIQTEEEKDEYHDVTYKRNLKKWYKQIYLQNRNRLIDIENKYMVTKGER